MIDLSGGKVLETEYTPGDNMPGWLELTLRDATAAELATSRIRLDPWVWNAYRLYEWQLGGCLVISGTQGLVALDALTLNFGSSVSFQYKEVETLKSPWFNEAREQLVVATTDRVWCLNEHGTIRWVWSATTTDVRTWIAGCPTIAGDRVTLPLRTLGRDLAVDLLMRDGLPIEYRR